MNIIKRKKFKDILDSSESKTVRNQVIHMLIDQAQEHIDNPKLDRMNRYEILEAISYFKTKNTLSSNRAYKIFLLAEYGIDLVNTYEMRGSHCIPRHYLSKKNPSKPRQQIKPKRRPSVYSWTGMLLPRSYLDKLSTPIHNQSDYDRYQERITGMTKIQFNEQRYLGRITHKYPVNMGRHVNKQEL